MWPKDFSEQQEGPGTHHETVANLGRLGRAGRSTEGGELWVTMHFKNSDDISVDWLEVGLSAPLLSPYLSPYTYAQTQVSHSHTPPDFDPLPPTASFPVQL